MLVNVITVKCLSPYRSLLWCVMVSSEELASDSVAFSTWGSVAPSQLVRSGVTAPRMLERRTGGVQVR